MTDVDRRRLLELAAASWDGTLAADPLHATAIGDRRFLAALPPNDADAGRRERARVTALLDKVSRIDPSGLPPRRTAEAAGSGGADAESQ